MTLNTTIVTYIGMIWQSTQLQNFVSHKHSVGRTKNACISSNHTRFEEKALGSYGHNQVCRPSLSRPKT